MNTTHTHSTLYAAAELGCRIQIWHLRPGATSSADGQWDDADPAVKPTFECPAHLYRVHPDDLHLLRADNERRARELLAAEYERRGWDAALVEKVRRGAYCSAGEDAAIRAIVAALEEAPAGSVGGEAECMGWVFQHEDTGRMTFCPNDGVNNPSIFVEINAGYALCGPAYTRPAPAVANDVVYADADALIAHLDELIDDNGQGGEKWDPAQAAIAGIRAWQNGSEIAPAPAVVDEAMVERARQCIVALRQHAALFSQDDIAMSLYAEADALTAALAQPQGREAVDLEQFRTPVEYWRDHTTAQGARADANRAEADRLLAILDAQSAKGDGDAS